MQTFRTFLVVCHVIGFEVGWFFVMMISGGLVWAAENRNTLQMVVQIQPRASLSLERTQITFAGPEDQGLIPSQEGPVQLTVKVRASASQVCNPEYAG